MQKQKFCKDLNQISIEELFKIPLNQLRIFQVPDYIKEALEEVKKELKAKHILIRPKIWVSEEWICPDGTAGIGVPFYLGSKRLLRMEKKEVGFVEGETKEKAKKLIRHELGHVVDNLFRLRRNRERINIFGKNSKKYPNRYDIQPYSKNYVRHLKDGYAQGHPAEDFAETFAVWLDPQSNWKKKYQNWGCLKKLLYMDQLMHSLQGVQPIPYDKNTYYEIRSMDKTYGKYLLERKKKFNLKDTFWDNLKEGFNCRFKTNEKMKIKHFLSRYGKEIIGPVSFQTKLPKYLVKRMLDDIKKNNSDLMIDRILPSKKIMSYHIIDKANAFINEGRHFIRL